jgi:hypothetical protein
MKYICCCSRKKRGLTFLQEEALLMLLENCDVVSFVPNASAFYSKEDDEIGEAIFNNDECLNYIKKRRVHP